MKFYQILNYAIIKKLVVTYFFIILIYLEKVKINEMINIFYLPLRDRKEKRMLPGK